MPRTALSQTLPPFNGGLPLEVVVADGPGEATGDTENRIVLLSRDAGYARGWRGFELTVTSFDLCAHRRLILPTIPSAYGRWVQTSIGGLSATVRRTGMLRCLDTNDPVVLFAVQAATPTAVSDVLAGSASVCTVGETQHDAEMAHVTEVVVFRSADVASVCAAIARAGAVPMFEMPSLDAKRALGIERLDRIGADVVTTESMIRDDDEVFGLRRGSENWQFSWLPRHWTHVPITWDHLVHNVISEPVETLPQPLRQHVAKARIDSGDHPPVGSVWEPCPLRDVPSPEVIRWNATLGPEYPLQGIYKRIVQLPDEEREKVRHGRTDVCSTVTTNCVTVIDGTWYRPVNTKAFLDRCIPKGCGGARRWVTPHLTPQQSKQLIEAFYLLTVEKVTDADTRQACRLILFRYMLERGYTARWMGKYNQNGKHVGNGDTFRRFRRLTQYAPDRLPTEVLNKLCGRDGRLRNKGSKGTRSKYKRDEEVRRYVPTRRLTRTDRDERRMMSE